MRALPTLIAHALIAQAFIACVGTRGYHHPMLRSFTLLALLAVSGCDTLPGGLRNAAAVPDPAARLAAECALLAEAQQRDPTLHAGVTEGCPGVVAVDSRPLRAQMDSLRAAQAAALPAPWVAQTRADTVFRRMITRGVPVTLATELTRDPLFARAAR